MPDVVRVNVVVTGIIHVVITDTGAAQTKKQSKLLKRRTGDDKK